MTLMSRPLTRLLAAAALMSSMAASAAVIDSNVEVSVDALGDVGFDADSLDRPGPVKAGCVTSNCNPASGPDPQNAAVATARTDYGSNRATVYAGSLNYDVVSSARALSYWQDEWTFTGVQPGDVVTLRFRLDGNWTNVSGLAYRFGVFDPTLPFSLGPDELAPGAAYGHPIEMEAVATASEFLAADQRGFQFAPPSALSFDDPADWTEGGTIDWSFDLQWQPVEGRTYTLASALDLFVSIRDGLVDPTSQDTTPAGVAARAEFGNTVALTEVVLPDGVSLSSSAGAVYNIAAVPEPDVWAMLLAGLGVLAGVARRRRGAGA